eukprot:TRINITY_DN2130_c0_g1_i1.p1 TRINITY_DN2130_c0_g1~~TRINITY_DN2130_c0_g1_i1.p1  ORF type:complete len:132 (-),score=40.33 TRINITY_DN2130_c0_g1_i1:25-366(-)
MSRRLLATPGRPVLAPAALAFGGVMPMHVELRQKAGPDASLVGFGLFVGLALAARTRCFAGSRTSQQNYTVLMSAFIGAAVNFGGWWTLSRGAVAAEQYITASRHHKREDEEL